MFTNHLETSPPTVSVCIPVRNGARQLPHTLSNLLIHSSYPRDRVEVVLGDHGSTDSTPDLVDRLACDFPNLRRVRVEYDGPNRAHVRNRLLQACTGEIVVFIDHDVLVHSEFIAAHVAAHRAFPGSLVAGETFGKGFFKQEIEDSLRALDLSNISHALPFLKSNPELADIRTRPEMLPVPRGSEELIDLSEEPAAFRFCWTCNVSARRADIDQCGAFDESYEGWGVEDDDFAQQFRVCDKRLLFSRKAWGLHLPHAVDLFANIATWRRNFDRFFRKFGTREIEYYSLFGHDMGSASRFTDWTIAQLRADAGAPLVAEKVPPRTGRRMAHFVFDIETAKALDLTDALDPSAPPRSRESDREGVRFWPFLGARTLFEAAEIAETVILADRFLFLDRHLTVLLLEEAARVSKRLLVVTGPRFEDERYGFARDVLRDTVRRLRFEQVVWA